MIKSIPSGLNNLTQKNKRCYVHLPVSYMHLSFSKDHQNGSNKELLLLLSDSLWKVKAKYIVLCLNASANFQNANIVSHYPTLMSNCPTCSHMS